MTLKEIYVMYNTLTTLIFFNHDPIKRLIKDILQHLIMENFPGKIQNQSGPLSPKLK